MKNHKHLPSPNAQWYTTSPYSSWNSDCATCGSRINLVTTFTTEGDERIAKTFWRAVHTPPMFHYTRSYTG